MKEVEIKKLIEKIVKQTFKFMEGKNNPSKQTLRLIEELKKADHLQDEQLIGIGKDIGYVKDNIQDIKNLLSKENERCIFHDQNLKKKLDLKADKWVEKVIVGIGGTVGTAIILAILSLILKNGGA